MKHNVVRSVAEAIDLIDQILSTRRLKRSDRRKLESVRNQLMQCRCNTRAQSAFDMAMAAVNLAAIISQVAALLDKLFQ